MSYLKVEFLILFRSEQYRVFYISTGQTTHILYKKGWKGNDIESGTAEYT